MRKIRVQDAIGEPLCHDLTVIVADGTKGVGFKRGHIIAAGDIPALLDMGKTHIYVWEPGADEVHEDEAAMRVTEAACGPNITYSGPAEGKMEMRSAIDGLFRVKGQALKLINSVGDYTVASRPNFTPVARGDRLAGARIVPLTTKRANLEAAVAIADANRPVFSVMPFLPLKTGVVITGSEIYHGRVRDAFEPILRAKLATFGAEMIGFTKSDDDVEMILGAARGFIDRGAQVVLFTGGMSVDPDDVTPAAIRQSGATLIAQGVPMQPGNMLTIAYLGDIVLVGVPGASMHSPTTSLDTFLPRVYAGLRVTRDEIASLGEGGLCLGCSQCHYPLCSFGRR